MTDGIPPDVQRSSKSSSRRGIVHAIDGAPIAYRADASIASIVAALAQTLKVRPVAVVTLIHGRAEEED